MEKKTVPKSMIQKIGRIFALLFNRVAMYDVNHPFTRQSATEFLNLIRQRLDLCSPLVLMLNQDQFFIEDEALNPQLNTDRLLAHFNKTGIRSISFSAGLDAEDLNGFLTIFTDPGRFPNADSMTSALAKQEIRNVCLNHDKDQVPAADKKATDSQRLKASLQSTEDSPDRPLGEATHHPEPEVAAEDRSADGLGRQDDEPDSTPGHEGIGGVQRQRALKIGEPGRDLLRDAGLDPKRAAELIYLAADIRKKTDDPDVISDLLADYIEQIGSKLAMDRSDGNAAEDGSQLRQLISGIETKMVSCLRSKDIDPDVLDRVARRLKQRLEAVLENLQKQWALHAKHNSEIAAEEPAAALTTLEESDTEGNELDAKLQQVGRKHDNLAGDEKNADQIPSEITRSVEKQGKGNRKDDRPLEFLNRRSTLYILEKEIARSLRYGSPFSVLMISIIKILPQTQLPTGSLSQREVNQAILEKVIGQVRSTDIIGQLDKRNLLVLMPMTIESESKIAMRRILKLLQNTELTVGSNKIKIRPAGTITAFDHQRTPTLEKFIQQAETEIFDMVNRLRNIRNRY